MIGVTTPMIGLTGTVTGMIRAFESLGESGIGDPSQLSGAIGEVLVATARRPGHRHPGVHGLLLSARPHGRSVIHHIQDIINDLFRKMPYEALAGRPHRR